MTNEQPILETTVAVSSWRRTAAWTFAILAVVYTASWLATAMLLKHQAAAWIAFQGNNGLVIESGPLDMGGFPGRVRIAARDVTVTAPGWTWHADKLRLKTWPLGLWRLTIDASGRHTIAGLATPPEIPAWLAAGKLEAELHLELTGQLREAALTMADVNAGVLAAQPMLRLQTGTVALSLLRPAAPPADAPSPTLPATSRIETDLKGLSLPFPLPAPLDQPIERAAATVEITGPIAPGPLPQVLEAWRSGGGTLEVRAAALDWPPLHMSGSGTVALDHRLQPEGAFSLKFQGGGETLDALAGGGWMEADDAGIAKLGLTLLARRGADGAPEINVPLTLQDRQLSAGPVTLMTLPEIMWRGIEVP